jgi:hypothetical protein
MDGRFLDSWLNLIRHRAALSLVLAIIAAAPGRALRADDSLVLSTPARASDQLWVVSCRGLAATATGDEAAHLRYARYQTNAGWAPSTAEEFRAGALPQSVICVLVLGNGYSSSDTRAMGQKAFRRLTADLTLERPVRFVTWSWPSDHADTGPIKDLRIKAGRTWQVSHQLARWLDEAQPSGTISLLGASFGARIVMQSLELRAEGRSDVAKSTDPASDETVLAAGGVNVVLVSAALDNDWLLPGRRLDMSLSQINRLVLINNSSDRVLKRYHWLYGRRSTATALGNSGLPASIGSISFDGNLRQYDAAPIIGRQHGCSTYFDSPRLVALMRDGLFTEPATPASRDPSPGPELTPSEGASIPLASGTGRP